jgi:hypothetical protein
LNPARLPIPPPGPSGIRAAKIIKERSGANISISF